MINPSKRFNVHNTKMSSLRLLWKVRRRNPRPSGRAKRTQAKIKRWTTCQWSRCRGPTSSHPAWTRSSTCWLQTAWGSAHTGRWAFMRSRTRSSRLRSKTPASHWGRWIMRLRMSTCCFLKRKYGRGSRRPGFRKALRPLRGIFLTILSDGKTMRL